MMGYIFRETNNAREKLQHMYFFMAELVRKQMHFSRYRNDKKKHTTQGMGSGQEGSTNP